MKFNKTLLQKLTSTNIMGFRTARADDGDTGTDSTQPGETSKEQDETSTPHSPQASVDFETLISRARKEEKEKLYPEITRLKDELEKKVSRVNELLLTIGEKDEIISQKDKEMKEVKTNSKKTDSQEVKELTLKVTELENNLSSKDSEISTIKLDSYKQQKIAEAGGELIPELVLGNSEEEIDLAVERAKERYADIVSKVAKPKATPKEQDSNNIPPANPNTNAFSTQVSSQSLADIDLMTPEGKAKYAELRKQMGLI